MSNNNLFKESLYPGKDIKIPKTKLIRNKSFKRKRNLQAPSKEVYQSRLKPGRKQVRHKDAKYKKLLDGKCASLRYLTSIWKKTFGALSRYIVFNYKKDCKEKLILEILKDFNNEKYNNMNINNIKELLIKIYKNFLRKEKYEKVILNSWKKQNKDYFYNMYLSDDINIEEIINNNMYLITDIDILLISLYLNIGLVLLYPSREGYNIKLSYFNNDKTYYIKVPNKNEYYLIVDDKKFHYNIDELNKEFIEYINIEKSKSLFKRLLF